MKLFSKSITIKRLFQKVLEDFIVEPLFSILAIITLPLMRQPIKNGVPKQILLVSHRALMADYLAEIPEILSNDKRITFFILNYFWDDWKGAKEYIQKKLPFPRISRFQAYFQKWDLIIVSSVPQRHLVNNSRCPTLFIEHGIAAGGIRDGQLYQFGPSIYRNNRGGESRFTKFFLPSDFNRDRATSIDPNLKDKISVVGFYRDDKMLDTLPKREDIRKELGFQQNDNVVFTLSSWGPDCLFNTIGDAYLRQAQRIRNEFKFILNIHPVEHRPKPRGERNWGEYLRTQRKYGFVVKEPYEDWIKYMIASDVIVTDFTSLALHAVLLRIPVVYVPFSEQSIAKDGLVWKLKKISPVLNPDVSNLRERLHWALDHYPLEKFDELAPLINSHLGQAKKLYKEEIYKLLKLSPNV